MQKPGYETNFNNSVFERSAGEYSILQEMAATVLLILNIDNRHVLLTCIFDIQMSLLTSVIDIQCHFVSCLINIRSLLWTCVISVRLFDDRHLPHSEIL